MAHNRLKQFLTLAPDAALVRLGATAAGGDLWHLPAHGAAIVRGPCVAMRDPEGSLKAAGAIDILALAEQKHTPDAPALTRYAAAVSWAKTHMLGETFADSGETDQLATELLASRRLFDLLNTPGLVDKTPCIRQASLRSNLSKTGMDCMKAQSGWAVLGTQGAAVLRRTLETLGVIPNFPEAPAIVLPWYVAPHVIGGVSVYATVDAQPKICSWWAGNPQYTHLSWFSGEVPRILADPVLAGSAMNADRGPWRFCTAVPAPMDESYGWAPEHSIVFWDD